MSKYRPELDGLRTFAVLAVFIYHAELTWKGLPILSGGFLGVDIFFVLSGFLITGILIEKDISIFRFYKSRIDRIYPALLLMLFLTCFAAYAFLAPKNLLSYIDSLKGALAFYSNYVFMHEDAYISDASKYKPLIHTWTLGIEWQFYMLFPIIVFTIKKYFKKNINELFGLLFLISFLYSLYLINLNSTKAFYSTPSRVWELFAGSIIYLISKNISKSSWDSYLSMLGMSILIYAVIFFKDTYEIPGFISLLTVIGTSLFILFIRQGSLIYKVMSYKYIVLIGILSYSLYLYHQPVLVFYRVGFSEVNSKSFVLLFLISLILAACSYYWFENPIRRSQKKSKYFILIALLVLIGLFINGALNTEGYSKRQPEQVRKTLEYFNYPEYRALTDESGKSCNMRNPKDACFFNKNTKELIAVGDSFVGVFTRALSEQNISLRSFQHEQCPLMSTPIWFGGVPNCWEINKARWLELEKIQPSNILIGTNFHQFNGAKLSVDNLKSGENNTTTPVSKETAMNSFKQSIEKLIDMGHNPIVLLQTPNVQQDVVLELQRKITSGALKFQKEFNATSSQEVDNEIIALLSDLNVKFINLNKKLCLNNKCLTFNETGGLFNGGSHLSYFGAQLFIDEILESLKSPKKRADLHKER